MEAMMHDTPEHQRQVLKNAQYAHQIPSRRQCECQQHIHLLHNVRAMTGGNTKHRGHELRLVMNEWVEQGVV
jgi:hypothetical protein